MLMLIDLYSHFSMLDLDKLSSPSISPPPMQLMPFHSLQLKITLKLSTQTQKPAHICYIVHKDKVLNSDIESEDDNNAKPHGSNGKRPLTMHHCQTSSVSMAPASLPPPLMPVQVWSMVHVHALSLSGVVSFFPKIDTKCDHLEHTCSHTPVACLHLCNDLPLSSPYQLYGNALNITSKLCVTN